LNVSFLFRPLFTFHSLVSEHHNLIIRGALF
jgi:hypothetical protein